MGGVRLNIISRLKNSIIEAFKIEGNKITRQGRHCPKCGPGVFLAEHKNRFSCGKCGYTEFKSSSKKEEQRPSVSEPVEKTEGKPVEQQNE